tara:strand:+ start:556 stop:1482 length:927 start_codon:yes stop_codon:yes gene_type:complete
MEASITFKSVAKIINNKTLLADLSFGVEKGTRLALVGNNGSGKSTIIKLLSGILRKDKGSIYVKGFDINVRPNEIKALIGYMPQNSDFNLSMTVFDNLLVSGQLHGLSKENSKNRIIDLCERISFYKYLNFYPNDLSFGLMRIATFIRSIIHRPEIILLDEPTTNVDPVFKDIIWNYIYEDLNDNTIIYTTNNFDDAQKFSDRIAILHQGVIKYNGTFDYLVENTHGLARFSILFKEKVSEDLIKKISLNPKIIKPRSKGKELTFYSVDKTEYFKILKIAFDLTIEDINIAKCSLDDIFKNINSQTIE